MVALGDGRRCLCHRNAVVRRCRCRADPGSGQGPLLLLLFLSPDVDLLVLVDVAAAAAPLLYGFDGIALTSKTLFSSFPCPCSRALTIETLFSSFAVFAALAHML